MPLILVSNPVCGAGKGHAFVQDHVLPLLQQHGAVIDKTIVTEHAGHAGLAVKEFADSTDGPLSLILSSGDGTLHEIVNAICSEPGLHISIALIPSGTANALYSSRFPPGDNEQDTVEYKLQSVVAFLTQAGTVALSLARTVIQNSPAGTESVVSAVVTSTSLHASILHESESLRATVPDMTRFKIAASNNIARWYSSSVTFSPTPSGRLSIYDPGVGDFVDLVSDKGAGESSQMKGPFSYFLSTVNVDRLEPAFTIAPLYTKKPPELGAMDVVVVRPQWDRSESQQEFVGKISAVLSGAYREGSHVRLRYGENDSVTEIGDGKCVVEYIRCGGWEWSPDEFDEAAHLLCADGTIFRICKGGKAVCKMMAPDESPHIFLYV